MEKRVAIVGAGLAGSECALQLARRGIPVDLYEMRPIHPTAVHKTSDCAELVCSNSLKSTKPASAAGMIKRELDELGSVLYEVAQETAVPAGGALAVDRGAFARRATELIDAHELEILSLRFMNEGKEYTSYLKGETTDLGMFYRMMREGKLPVLQIGKYVYVHRDQWEAHIQAATTSIK